MYCLKEGMINNDIKGGDRMKWNHMLKAAGIAVLLFSVLAYTAPSLKAVQAKSPTVSSHTYKKIKELKYPQVHHIGNAAFEKKINQELKAYIEQSYQEYLKTKSRRAAGIQSRISNILQRQIQCGGQAQHSNTQLYLFRRRPWFNVCSVLQL